MEINYIDILIENCERAKEARPNNILTLEDFILEDIDRLRGLKNAIYIIEEIGGDIDETYAAFKAYKATKEKACPKLNKYPSHILYVGSTTRNVRCRIKQHMGQVHKTTCALNLNHWFTPRKLQIRVETYDVPREVLEIIEEARSHDLQPAFGK